MKSYKQFLSLFGVMVAVIILVVIVIEYLGITNYFLEDNSDGVIINKPIIKDYEITANTLEWNFGSDVTENVLAFNNTIPGKEIRLVEGDIFRGTLNNKLTVPVTIHWHGMDLVNKMDGVSGLTQEPVNPGESFTYEFKANKPGTYWYHSHHNSAIQVDKGLYGAFIVEPKVKKYDKDFSLIFDEWLLDIDYQLGQSNGSFGNSKYMNFGDMDTEMLYNTFTVNGKLAPDVQQINVQEGETVRLRLINAGYMVHRLHFGDVQYKVVAADGNDILNASLTKAILEIAPSERIDIEFKVNNQKSFIISSVDADPAASYMQVPIIINDEPLEVEVDNTKVDKDVLQLYDYAEMESIFSVDQQPTVEFLVNLDVGISMGEGLKFTINDKAYPNTSSFKVSLNDIVKMTITNNSELDHPMHLHGHNYQVLSRNDNTLKNAFVKDVINVKPGEKYTIMFKADNPGQWAFHCHDLLHAEGGMKTTIEYE